MNNIGIWSILLTINIAMSSAIISMIFYTSILGQSQRDKQSAIIRSEILTDLDRNRNVSLGIINQTHSISVINSHLLSNLFGNSSRPSLAAELSMKNLVLSQQILDILRNQTNNDTRTN